MARLGLLCLSLGAGSIENAHGHLGVEILGLLTALAGLALLHLRLLTLTAPSPETAAAPAKGA